MLKKLLNIFLLANGISPLDEKGAEPKEDKWAERRRIYGERPWEDQVSKPADEHTSDVEKVASQSKTEFGSV